MRGMKILLLAVLSLALVVWLPQRASAATCKGWSCNGLDPVTSGCYLDALVVSSSSIYDSATRSEELGIVSLKWSATCQAAYAQTFSKKIETYSIMARTWGGYLSSGNAPRVAQNAVIVTSLLVGADSSCGVIAQGTIWLGPTTSSPWGSAGSGKSCP